MSDCFDHEADAWDSLEFGREDEPDACGGDWYGPRRVTCRYCDEEGFVWTKTEHGWRLFKKGEIHSCSAFHVLKGLKNHEQVPAPHQ